MWASAHRGRRFKKAYRERVSKAWRRDACAQCPERCARILATGALYTEILLRHPRIALHPSQGFHGIHNVNVNAGHTERMQFVGASSTAQSMVHRF